MGIQSSVTFVIQGGINSKIERQRVQKCTKSIRRFLPKSVIVLSTWLNTDTADLDFDECILSFQSAANPHSRNVRSRIDQLSSYGDVSISTEFINYALIDDIVDSFIPLLKVIELEVDSIEELVLIPGILSVNSYF